MTQLLNGTTALSWFHLLSLVSKLLKSLVGFAKSPAFRLSAYSRKGDFIATFTSRAYSLLLKI
jgi:hypothetical protein